MEKLLLILLPFFSQAQTCPPYQCVGHQVVVNGTLNNTSYNGNVCFSGSGTIGNSINVNNWNILTFAGDLDNYQVINFSNGAKKIYIGLGKNVYLPRVSFDGQDTIFNSGNLIIGNWTSNNSFTNAIVSSAGATLKIDGVFHNQNDTLLNVVNNQSNILVINKCQSNPLPVVLAYFKTEPLRWKFSSVINIEKVELQWSENAVDWLLRNEYYWVRQDFEYMTYLSQAGYYRLKITDLNGEQTFSKIIRIAVNITVPSKKYNLLGQLATEADRIYIQDHKLYYKQ